MVEALRPTSDEFERMYAERNGMSVEELHQWGRWAEPCECDCSDCEGWAMGYQWEDAIVENRVRARRAQGVLDPKEDV